MAVPALCTKQYADCYFSTPTVAYWRDSDRLSTGILIQGEELEQKASFWWEMLKECPDVGDTKCQRMREALLLAEYKLVQMMDENH